MNPRRGWRGRQRGSVLVLCYLLVLALMAFGSALMARSSMDQRTAQQHLGLLRAFQAAEAGIDDALTRLRSPVNGYWDVCTAFTAEGYSVQCEEEDGRRHLVSLGTFTAPLSGTTSRQLEVTVQRFVPPNFYDHVSYAAGALDIDSHAAYAIEGSVLVSQALAENIDTSAIVNDNDPPVTVDPTAAPLPQLDLAQLYAIAVSQGNVYDAKRLAAIQQKKDAFPSAFCYDGSPLANTEEDPTPCEPNVNYITTDLVLNGNIGTIGGFFVVVGSVLTDPTVSEDTTVNGSGSIAGAIYTTGQFQVNGGGGSGFNVDGGIWAGTDVDLSGSVNLTCNAAYMNAIKNLHINADVQLLFWRDCTLTECT